MRIKIIITLAFVALLLSVAVVPVATASDRVPGTTERTTLVETSLAASSAWSLMPWDVETGSVTLSLDAAGNNEASSAITCMKPSDAATVRRAFMVAATIPGGGSISAGDITIDGNPITWDFVIPSVLGSSYNYFTEVTALVKAKVDAAPAGLVSFTIVEVNKNSQIDGEILAVVFDDPAQAATNYIVLLFGSQVRSGDSFTINLDRPICKADSDLVLDLSLGISFGYQAGGTQQYSILEVNGQRLSTAAGGEDDGAPYNGGLITVGGVGDSNANPPDPYATPANCRSDDELYNLIPFVSDGDTSITVSTSNPSYDDNLMFAALFMSNKVPLGEAIDYYAEPVTSAGNEEWFGQTSVYCFDGDAAQSGKITHSQSTSLTTNVTGPGAFIFYWKVSCQKAYKTGQRWVGDRLVFKADGVEQATIFGERDWIQYRVYVGDGIHELTWTYIKDGAVTEGSDCGWVDRLILSTVVDYSSPPYYGYGNDGEHTPFLEFLTSIGVTGMLRYIDPYRANRMTKEECETLRKAGFAVGLIWELPINEQAQRKAILGKKKGRDAMIASANQTGTDHAIEALKQVAENALDVPVDVPIYFCIDWDFLLETDTSKRDDERDAYIQYFRAIKTVFDDEGESGGHGRPVGAYAGQSLIKILRDQNVIDYGWACAPWLWSTTRVWDGDTRDIQLRQTPQVSNIQYSSKRTQTCDLDFNDPWTDDWGGWEPKPMETLSVPVDTSTGITTSMTFETGKHYLIEATGYFQFKGTSEGIRDAKYQFTTPPFKCGEINQGYTATWYGNLRIRDKENEWDWGRCSSDHVYRVPYTGEGTQLDFYIHDDVYDDNSGSVVVNIFEYP